MNKSTATEEVTTGIAGQALSIPDIVNLPNQPPLSSLDDNNVVTKGNLNGALGSDDEILILAGTAWPAELVVGVDFATTLLRPLVMQVISGATDTDTTEGANVLLTRYKFTDNTKTALERIFVLTTTDDGTTVAVDTWVRII